MDPSAAFGMNSDCQIGAIVGVETNRLESALEEILVAEATKPHKHEDRWEKRYPFPKLIQLTPVDDNGKTIPGEVLTVVGSNLSLRGINFFCQRPLAYRRVIASIPRQNGPELHVLVDLKWCRFVTGGWFDNGGQFIQLVEKKEKEFIPPDKNNL